MNMESLLFKFRCENSEICETLLSNFISFEKCSVVPFSHQSDVDFHPKQPEKYTFYYKIPLSLGLSLMNKKYFPIKGFFYILPCDLCEVVQDIFRSGLQLSVNACQRVLVDDDRMIQIFNKLKDPDSDFGYKGPVLNRNISLSNIDELAKNHFPPCMKKLYNNLKANHHLKYSGRLQLGLFLKGLGLPLEESLQF